MACAPRSTPGGQASYSDSAIQTGLKIVLVRVRRGMASDKHGQRARRHWRKLHLAVDAANGQIVAVTLTDQDVDDPSQVAPLLERVPGEIEQVTADGAYDGEPTDAIIAARDQNITVVIPPRATSAVLGRLGWQEVSGYGRRALVKTAMGRYKARICPRLRARSAARQGGPTH